MKEEERELVLTMAGRLLQVVEGETSTPISWSEKSDASLNELGAAINSLVSSYNELLLERSLLEAPYEEKRLEGIIPICMFCKKIRNSEDRWQKYENFIEYYFAARFSHSICPECFLEHYGEFE